MAMTMNGIGGTRPGRTVSWLRIALWTVLGGLVVVVGLFGYQLGIEQSKVQMERLDKRIADLTDSEGQLKQAVASSDAALQAERQRARALEERIAREVPTGAPRDLLAQIIERINAGIEPLRLSFIINQLPVQRQCEPSASRRIQVHSGGQRAAIATLQFGGETLSFTFEGQAGRDGNYDPAKPVTLKVAPPGANRVEIAKVLPFKHSVLSKGFEYRFQVSAGGRGQVQVVAERCVFP